MASIWQKTKSGVWDVKYRRNGKQYARSLKTHSKREALRLRKEIELIEENTSPHEFRRQPEPVENHNDPQVAEFWDAFQEWAKEHRSRKTIQEYTNWFSQLRDFKDPKTLGDIRRSDIEAFKMRLRREGRRRRTGLCDVSINNGLKTLSSIFNRAIKLGLYSGANPVAGCPARVGNGHLDR